MPLIKNFSIFQYFSDFKFYHDCLIDGLHLCLTATTTLAVINLA